MPIDKELIERYHDNSCTPAEKAIVEAWLFDDETEEELQIPSDQDKYAHKQEIWASITSSIPELAEKPKVFNFKDYFSPLLSRAIAASVVIGLLATATLFWLHLNTWNKPVTISNLTTSGSEKIQTQGLNIVLAPQSKANINASAYHQSGNIDFCGSIMINPKEDFELTLHGNCASPSGVNEKISMKKGKTYIAVNYRFNKQNELIIVDERNLTSLPPLLQREIMAKFNI